METIDTITLRDVLPEVFAITDETPAPSQVWRQDGLTLRRGHTYLIEAASGTGKSSLCSYIYGNRHDYRGQIEFNGQNIKQFGINRWCQIRTRHLSLLPQEMRLFGELTALENVQIKNSLTGHKTESQIRQMFEMLEIDNRIDRRADHLSIGQQQRVAIIRALCQPFDFIFLDEPVSHLDARNNSIVSQMIQAEAASQGAAIVSTSVGNPLAINTEYTLAL